MKRSHEIVADIGANGFVVVRYRSVYREFFDQRRNAAVDRVNETVVTVGQVIFGEIFTVERVYFVFRRLAVVVTLKRKLLGKLRSERFELQLNVILYAFAVGRYFVAFCDGKSGGVHFERVVNVVFQFFEVGRGVLTLKNALAVLVFH